MTPDQIASLPPELQRAAERELYEELGFSFLAQNSALTVTIFKPKFRVASLHQLDKKWDVVYLMDKAWELLVNQRAYCLQMQEERDARQTERDYKEAEYEKLRVAFYRMCDDKDHKLSTAEATIATLTREKNGAYTERDNLVAALSKIFPSSLERHPDSDTAWDDDWRWIVFVELPTGQATWHIHDSELAMFDHLQRHTGKVWDGHTTPQKYLRLAALSHTPEGGGQ